MGIGPSFAIPKVLEMTGIDKSEVDLFEVNLRQLLSESKPDSAYRLTKLLLQCLHTASANWSSMWIRSM
jgi:hypothetical protein